MTAVRFSVLAGKRYETASQSPLARELLSRGESPRFGAQGKASLFSVVTPIPQNPEVEETKRGRTMGL